MPNTLQQKARRVEGPCDSPNCAPCRGVGSSLAVCRDCGWRRHEHTNEVRSIILAGIYVHGADYVAQVVTLERVVSDPLSIDVYTALGEREG